MVKYLGKTEHDLDLVTKSYLVQQLSNVTDDSALASALSSYIKSSDANNLVSELRSEVEEKLRGKVAKADNKALSTNDFTNEFRQKLENSYTNEQIEQKIREATQNIDLSQYMTQSNADNRYAQNSQANTFTNNITIEHSLNDRSTSLFLKRGSNHYEFFTDANGDFGVYDKRNNSTLLRLNNSTSQFYKDLNMNNKRINNVANATSGKDAVSRDYGDSRYARTSHTHTSSDISDSITRIGTHASANKLVKTDSDGFIDFIAPSDSSPDKTVILKGYLDTKLGQKADSDHNHNTTYYQKSEYINDPGASDKANKPLKSNANGGLTLTNTPAENTDAVNKLYVDSKVADISLPDSGMTQAQADQRYIRSNAATSTLGRHLTVDASDDGNYSASLFLKKNNHQYEFYTNASGKFGAWDKTNERNLFSADRNSFRHDTNVDMANNRITNLPEPNGANQPATKSWTESQLDGYYAKTEHVHTINSTTNNKPIKTDDDGNIHLESTPSSNHHIANKQYVDGQIDTVLQGIPGALGAAGFISQENADTRYARTEHTHVSADITDTITAIGTVASANKIVKTDSTGFLNIVAPTDSSPGKSIVLKSYLDEKLRQKADSNHTHTGYLSESDVTIDIGGHNARSKVVKTGTDGQLNITADPTSGNHAVRKSYVDRKVREAGSSGGTANGITQSTADSRYARSSHTHDSADITNTTNRIGTSASANKVVKLDSSGFLDVVTPNDSSPGNSVIVKSYMESKLNEKASTSELETLRSTITQLQNKIQELEANAGKVKNSATNRYLDVWVGPENQKPSDSTDKLVFVEKE